MDNISTLADRIYDNLGFHHWQLWGKWKALTTERDTLKEQVDIWRKGCEKALSVCKEREEIIEKHIEYDLGLMTQRNKAEAERDTLRGEVARLQALDKTTESMLRVCQAQRDTLRGALERFVRVDDADKSGKALFSCQGQGMDGFSKLAEYDAAVKAARKALAQGGDDNE